MPEQVSSDGHILRCAGDPDSELEEAPMVDADEKVEAVKEDRVHHREVLAQPCNRRRERIP
jgi:hypothetical protein